MKGGKGIEDDWGLSGCYFMYLVRKVLRDKQCRRKASRYLGKSISSRVNERRHAIAMFIMGSQEKVRNLTNNDI